MRPITYSTLPQTPTKIEWPLNGSICLAFALLFMGRNSKMIRMLLLYQFTFLILMPFAILLILNGHGLMEIIYGIHLKLYKLLFIFIGFLSIVNMYSKFPQESNFRSMVTFSGRVCDLDYYDDGLRRGTTFKVVVLCD